MTTPANNPSPIFQSIEKKQLKQYLKAKQLEIVFFLSYTLFLTKITILKLSFINLSHLTMKVALFRSENFHFDLQHKVKYLHLV